MQALQHPIIVSSIVVTRQAELIREAEQARLLSEAGALSIVDRFRLAIGSAIVSIGGFVAGRRWAPEARVPGAAPAAFKLAR